MKNTIILGLLFWVSFAGMAQESKQQFLVQAYLQNAEPNTITIKWETSLKGSSIVEWGTSPKLGKKTKGFSYDINFSDSRVHEVSLSGLKRFTTYYYRVKTDALKSDVFQFKTPPFASDHSSFNLVAMSDMQIDRKYPDKYAEIVNEGVLKYVSENYKGTVSDNIALVLVPGDLVENGAKYEQWQHDFFKPSEKLIAQVPLYPVLGNHERNSDFYFKYFSLPANGTPAYAEHWWYKDYGNTRIIGLNSNDGYRDSPQQYAWFKKILQETAANDAIDFVFAQMHHPHKSELWIPGETDFSGKVVKMLEDFSTKSGKPSIHFFGHTHGYSRGQSKTHKHLWVNVASAGGAIDNWGEFEGRDYDEFTVTQDEYGFVIVEVDADIQNPKFTLKRISRGNTIRPKNNVLTDSITVYKHPRNPELPKVVFPTDETVSFSGVVLKAGAFKSAFPSAFHAASQWQIATNKEFKEPIVDSWRQYQNWYYLEDRQKNDNLTDEEIHPLQPKATYFWRVRYRDQNLNWSPWSATATFTTKNN